MTRVRSVVVVGLMTADASCRECRVIPINVTIRTLTRRNRVGTRKWKCRVVMVKGRIGPHARVVAQLALLRKSRRRVIGIRRSLIVLQMARHACRAV
jgi:hypothetical protein